MVPSGDYSGLLKINNLNGINPIAWCTDGLSNTIAIAEDAGRPSYYRQGKLIAGSPSGAGWADPNMDYDIGNETTPEQAVAKACKAACAGRAAVWLTDDDSDFQKLADFAVTS